MFPFPPASPEAAAGLQPDAPSSADDAYARVVDTLAQTAWPTDLPDPLKPNAPRILRELTLRLGRYLDNPSAWLPSLNLANGSSRQQRSERRIACVQVIRSFIKYCNLATLRVGVPTVSGCLDLTLDYLAKQAGLPLRRVERALRDLQRAGLMRVRPQCERIEEAGVERYRGFAAIKYVSPKLFEAFGMKTWLHRERSRAHLREQRRRSQAHKQDRKAAQFAQTVLASQRGQTSRHTSRLSAAQQDEQARRMLMIKAGEMKALHPEWDRDQCYAAARKLLDPPG